MKLQKKLRSNLSSSTETEQETKVHNLRKSKRLTKTNPIVRLNNPVPSVTGITVERFHNWETTPDTRENN